jgi:hypothetical protein
LLRASGEFTGDNWDLDAISSGDASGCAIPHAQTLIDFAEAVVTGDEARRRELAEALTAALGIEGFIDAAGVVGTFNAIVRVADACGIPLEEPKEAATREIRQRLGVDGYMGVQPD